MPDAVMPPARAITALPVTVPAAIRGASRIACDAIEQVTNIVESMHANIAAAQMPLSRRVRTRTRGLTGFVYDSIRLVNSATRATLDKALSLIAADFGPSLPQPHADHALSALNGVVGDYLEATGNPLAIRMQMRRDGKPVNPEDLGASHRLLMLVHGLCMNDRQWTIKGHDRGAVLARQAGYTPIHLFYNTGRHVSENGRDFADKLEDLLRITPQSVEELVILAHSMGGLVTRSACHYGLLAGHSWLKPLRTIVFLGTPHHGAPLERGGNWLQTLGGISPYTAPLARLGMIRSAGVTDLRYGNLLDEDWNRADRFEPTGDLRKQVPLPAGINCYAMAATLATRGSSVSDCLIGDGLVPLANALGRHQGREKALRIPKSKQWIGYGMNHFELLHRRETYEQLREWLTEKSSTLPSVAP